MKLVCDLNNFFMRQLDVRCTEITDNTDLSINCNFDYDLFFNDEDDHKVCMILKVSIGPNETIKSHSPYEINAAIQGFFTFSDDLSDEQMSYLVRVNSATILYGILRGEIASVTGSFSAGKFLLPTVMMQDIVTEIEQRQ